MPVEIAFYVHHQGSGHLMRCLAISGQLQNCTITFLGSALKNYAAIIPDYIQCIHLPMDTPGPDDVFFQANEQAAGLHYAPLNVGGQCSRVHLLSRFFAEHPHMLLIVDVSVEVAMLASLCGVPYVYMRQHGRRADLAHSIAYRNAQLLLAPYPASFAQVEDPQWLKNRTFYTGGYSRFYLQSRVADEAETANRAAILVGSGGTSINERWIRHLASACPDWNFEILGLTATDASQTMTNVKNHGKLDEPVAVLQKCRVVIGNTGHNTVMETAALGKAFITIPEERAFDEQAVKAEILSRLNLAAVVLPEDIYTADWPALLNESHEAGWQGVIDPQALRYAAKRLVEVHQSVFPPTRVMV